MPRVPCPLLVVLVSSLVPCVASGAAVARAPRRTPAPAAPVRLLRPADGPVVRGFAAPGGPYGAGHRGLDVAAPGGTVRAAAAGAVTFAGPVAGSVAVSIDHGGGWSTRYSGLSEAFVGQGAHVASGTVVGRGGGGDRPPPPGPGPHLHFALVHDGVYVDPAPHLAVGTHLVPAGPLDGDPLAGVARRLGDLGDELRSALRSGGEAVSGVLERIGEAVDDAKEALAGLRSRLEREGGDLARFAPLLRELEEAAAGLAGDLREAARDPAKALRKIGGEAVDALVGRIRDKVREVEELVQGAALVARSAGVMTQWGTLARFLRYSDEHARSQERCTREAVPVPTGPGTPPTRNVVVAVQGIQSTLSEAEARGGRPRSPLRALLADLGVADDRVLAFSYRGSRADGTPLAYGVTDTWGSIRERARLLGEQLRRFHLARPHESVDLVGHSLGGVVVAYYLAFIHDPMDPTLPQVGRAVTIAAPHAGIPLAQMNELLRYSQSGRTLRSGVHWLPDHLAPDPEAPALRQLAETSRFVGRLSEAEDFAGVPVTAIGSLRDPLVPGIRARHPAATNVLVDGDGSSPVEDHSRMVTDAETRRAVSLALAGLPPACVGTGLALWRFFAADTVYRAEESVAAGAAVGGYWLDTRAKRGRR